MTASTAILILLGAGVATSSIALILDIRAHSPHGAPSRTGPSGRVVLYCLTVLSCGTLVAALVMSGLIPRSEFHGTPLMRVETTLLALALATTGGGPFAVLALRLATRGTSRAGIHGGILVNTNDEQSTAYQPPEAPSRRGVFLRHLLAARNADRSSAESSPPEKAMATSTIEVLRGGTTIGVLERIAIAGAIAAGFPEAIAVVIAIKGVGRFSELAASEAKERFIIGTLASFVWACSCALVLR